MEINKSNKSGQMKIQQMAFMIVAVFFFFILVGLFFLNIEFKDLLKGVENQQEEQAISSLKVIADMPEISCGSSEFLCLDEDKLKIMSGEFGKAYDGFWPVASVKVRKIHPIPVKGIKYPALNYNYYDIFDNGQKSEKTISTFISIFKTIKEDRYVYDKCEIGKLELGIKIYEE